MGRNEAQTSIPKTNDDHRPHCVKRDAGFPNRNVTQIPDAMSEKVCEVARRSQRLFHKDYNFVEESVCASSGGLIPGLAGNRESTNSEDFSSGGPPSPFLNLNAACVPLGREAMRGNDFSNTVFIDDSSPSDDNILAARNDFLPPGRKEPTCDNGEKVIQSTFPIGSSFNLHVLSDHGLLGSGSISPGLASENARVRRPPSIPVPDVDCGKCPSSSGTPALPVKEPDYESLQNAVTEYYTQFMNSVAQLKEAHHQRSLGSGVDADARQ
ncbi:hypothetical protein MKW98_015517 [Papaver atlanticum]|uniref:Uncharacterized protein n=1 Tax=Papaver atlanticum TaxID=357466 RepID=A0AAD4S4M9_9MAGN|nr:hypothetical protein MKW98_015517 [Papaver atlanticum]